MTFTLRNPSNDPVPNRLFGDAPVKGVSVIWHNGNDYGWGQGRQVYAAAAGRVSKIRWSNKRQTDNRSGGYGNYLIIDHGNGYSTLYAHLPNSAMLVHVGKLVAAGEMVGTMGDTGNASGVHLHFMLLLNGRIINPNPYITTSTTAGTNTEEIDMAITEAEWARIDLANAGANENLLRRIGQVVWEAQLAHKSGITGSAREWLLNTSDTVGRLKLSGATADYAAFADDLRKTLPAEVVAAIKAAL